MKKRIDQSTNTISDNYVDMIYHKSIFEMEEPVLSPITGHVYDKKDLIKWIQESGTDPIARNHLLTVEMIVPGLFVKHIALDGQRREDAIVAKFTILINDWRSEVSTEIKELKEDVTKYKSESEEWQRKYGLVSKELEQLKRNQEVWTKFGSNIDAKLKKGSVPERTEALSNYASKIKFAKTERELKNAVNDIKVINNSQMKDPRFFACFIETSETYRVANEFKNKVFEYKGWKR